MITKAIIQSIIDPFTVKVRIPLLDRLENAPNSVNNESLTIAHFCTPPGVIPFPEIGDVVYVGFEDEDTGKPVILGYLHCEKNLKKYSDIQCGNLNNLHSARLTTNTVIGDVLADNISSLEGIEGPLTKHLELINNRLYTLENT